MTKRSGQNIIDIVDDSKALIEKLKPQLPPGTVVAYSYDESQDIRDLVSDLENNIYTGLLLVLLVTLLFLGPVNALFVSLAIPFSMLMSFFVLDFMGITLNMVVLFSLVMALGMLVDNGIVIVENIFRHASLGKSRRQASIDGSKEVAWPIITSTLTTCLAFFPLIFMPGIMGDFMAFLPITVIVVLTCSLIVALTINPVFCASFMKISETNMKRITEGSGLFVRVQTWYEQQVRRSVKNPWKVLGISAIVVFSGIILYGLFGREPIFFPYIDPEDAIVSLEMAQGTPLDSTDGLVRQLETIVAEVPASLDNYQATTGRATGDVFSGIGEEQHKANIRVSYRPFTERTIKGQVALDSLKQRLGAIGGALVKVEEGESGPPTGNDISYQITGTDYVVMGAYADSLVAILKTYPEFKLVDTDYEPAKPEIAVDIDRAKAAFYKLSTQEIAAAVRNSINGATVGSFRLDEDEYDIVMRYQDDSRNSINHLAALQIVNNDDARIPLSSVASIGYNSSVGTIKRHNLQRAVGVWADFRPDVERKGEITQEIAKRVKSLTLPAGYRVQDGQGAEDRQESVDFLLKAFVIALFLIMAVLIAQFNSIVDTIIIMVTVLLSFGGVFWGYLITGEQFVIIMSGIGCIALMGVVVNNCIVLIDYMHLLIRQGMPWEDAVIEAGRTRLRPVLLTAITTVLGMLPMVLGVSFDFHVFRFQFGSDSTQMWKAFAMAMVTGLSFATIMTLVLVPVLMTLRYRYLPPKKGLDA
jgi:multidrug efflux pump subunit AcrB